jgi:hypothetical protein
MIPPKLRILGKLWQIKQQATKGGKDDGKCEFATKIIWVNPKQTEDSKRDTLLHEVIHALDEELQTKTSERQVRLLATGLLEVIRNNPAFMAYLAGD